MRWVLVRRIHFYALEFTTMPSPPKISLASYESNFQGEHKEKNSHIQTLVLQVIWNIQEERDPSGEVPLRAGSELLVMSTFKI